MVRTVPYLRTPPPPKYLSGTYPPYLPELQLAIALYCYWMKINLKHGVNGVHPEP